MAVQQNKPSPAKRGSRRSHDGLKKPTLSDEPSSGEKHRRHHLSKDGYYKGKLAVPELSN